MNPAGLDTGGRSVPPEWIDYNGHMMDAYYFLAFTEATEAFLDHVGLGAAYRAQTGSGMYTAEGHLCFLSGVGEGDIARLSTPIGLDIGGKAPWEVAVSVIAEITAVRYARGSGSASMSSPAASAGAPAARRTKASALANTETSDES